MKIAHRIFLGLLIVLMIGLSAIVVAEERSVLQLPAALQVIEDEAFMGATHLNTVIVPEGAKEIGNRAFADCEGLKEVVLPESISSIGAYAFSGCPDLTAINLPESLSIIKNDAFENCDQLVATVVWGSYAHKYCDAFSVKYVFTPDSAPTATPQPTATPVPTVTPTATPVPNPIQLTVEYVGNGMTRCTIIHCGGYYEVYANDAIAAIGFEDETILFEAELGDVIVAVSQNGTRASAVIPAST